MRRPSKTALLDAVKHLDIAAAEEMLDRDPALLGVTDSGRNLLHVACGVPTFRPKKADKFNDAYRRSAARKGLHGNPGQQVRFAKMLLERGLPVDAAYGRDKCTALFEAVARARNLRLVEFLFERGADVRRAPGGALFAASWWQDLDVLDALLRAGANVDVVVGVTPFLAAWTTGRFDAAKRLAERGADVNYQDKKGRTALYHGVEKEFDPALLSWLVKHGASPDIRAADGLSARRKAARKRDKRFLKALEQ